MGRPVERGRAEISGFGDLIFLTIGSHEPFDRLIRAVDAWRAARPDAPEVFGQITDRADYAPSAFEWTPYLTPAEYRERCRAAELIVSHAGMGSIITALTFGKPVAIMPRRGHLRETRNDHQFATAKRFDGRDGIWIAYDESELAEVLDNAVAAGADGAGGAVSPFAEERMIKGLREFIHGR